MPRGRKPKETKSHKQGDVRDMLDKVMRARRLVRLCERDEAEARAALESTRSTRTDEEKVDSTKIVDVSAEVARLESYCEKTRETKVRLIVEKAKAKELIERLRDKPEYYEVLYRRYIMGDKWERIAVDMNYNYRWVQRLHGRALQALEEIHNQQNHVDK